MTDLLQFAASHATPPHVDDTACEAVVDVLAAGQCVTRIYPGLAIDGGRSYHAQVLRGGEVLCQISLTGRYENETAAHATLQRHLDRWMAEYQTRKTA